MVEYDTNDRGNLTGLIEYFVVDNQGNIDDMGDHIFVKEFYVNPELRGNGSIAKFAHRLISKVPLARYCYFERRKYDNRIRIYPKDKWLKIISKQGGYNVFAKPN